MENGTFSTTEPKKLSLEELSALVRRFYRDPKSIVTQIKVSPLVMDELKTRIPEIKLPPGMKYEYSLLGMPVYSDERMPPGKIAMLNSDGEVIKIIDCFENRTPTE